MTDSSTSNLKVKKLKVLENLCDKHGMDYEGQEHLFQSLTTKGLAKLILDIRTEYQD